MHHVLLPLGTTSLPTPDGITSLPTPDGTTSQPDSCRDSSVAYVPQSPARGWCRLLGARGLRPYELRHQCSVHHGRTAYSEFSLLDLYTRDVLGTVSTVV